MTTQTREQVKVHIANPGDMGECLWATPMDGPGIYELDNFPISDVDYTAGDLVTAAENDRGELYVTGLAERRYRAVYLKYDDALAIRSATEKRRELRAYFEDVGCRLEWLLAGVCGLAVPIRIAEDAFTTHLAAAPYAVSEYADEDDA